MMHSCLNIKQKVESQFVCYVAILRSWFAYVLCPLEMYTTPYKEFKKFVNTCSDLIHSYISMLPTQQSPLLLHRFDVSLLRGR